MWQFYPAYFLLSEINCKYLQMIECLGFFQHNMGGEEGGGYVSEAGLAMVF